MASDLLLRETLSDVTLKVRHDGYSWRLPAHSLLLVSKSSVLEEMLAERSKDDKPTPFTFIGVMKPETGLAVLKYIYEEEFPTDVTADLLITAERYQLSALRDNLEQRFMSEVTILQACQMVEELHQRQPADVDCAIKSTCLEMLETHALTVFGSDLVMLLSKTTLACLLQTNNLNIPDDAYAFWGIWRWGRRYCSKNDKPLTETCVTEQIDDLIVLIRNFHIRNRQGIPGVASCRFNRCKGPRNHYCTPSDILEQSSCVRPCPTWEDIATPKRASDAQILCLQLSFEKDVMLVGMILEACESVPNLSLKQESYMHLIREADRTELRRQRIAWCRTDLRRTSVRGEPESRLDAVLILSEPIFLTPGHIYSVYFSGNFSSVSFPWAPASKRRLRVGNTFLNIHGEGVKSVRDVYLMPDMTVTWGPRGLFV